jgi:hypothetical protein
MTRPPRSPDLIVNFALTALRTDGSPKYVISGYRPIYKVKPDYWSSAHHEFMDVSRVETGQQAHAEVWLLSPEAYPQTFWIGRRVEVAEGARLIGIADVLQVLNPLLESSGPSTMDREIEIPRMDFTFQPRWKEELVCICPLGKLVLEMPMGVPSVYIPSEQAWQNAAPAWALPYWQALHLQLVKWCADHGFPLHVDKSASVFVA